MAPNKVNLLEFSEFIVRYFQSAKESPVSNLMLQKLLYYIQSYHLVYFDKHPLFDSQPEAWVNGPVYKQVYSEYKRFGSAGITFDDVDDQGALYQRALDKLNLSDKQSEFLMSALDFFGNKTPGELVFRSHSEKPWNDARKDLGPLDYCTNEIPHDIMYDFYKIKSEKHS